MTRTTKRTGAHLSNSPILRAVLIFIAVALLAFGIYWRFIHKTVRIVHLPAQSTSAKSLAQKSAVAAATPAQKVASPQGGSATSSAAPSDVTSPAGSFVSNHKPSSSTEQEQSLCTTTIGAQCSISFTKGSSVIKLDAQTTDDNGAATWNWTPRQLGLTSGEWSVSATATAGSKSATTTDPRPLEIP